MRVVRRVCSLCNSRCRNPRHFPAHVARSCERKVAYENIEDAVASAGSFNRAYSNGSYVYLCPLEDHFHLSTNRRMSA